jgi:short-subunit dehydrogenase
LTSSRQRRRETTARRWSQQVERQPGVALVTGASAGIGATFARALARQGFHLVLVARREDRLRQLADELEHTYSIKAEVLRADLTDPLDLERVAARLAEIPDLDLLVNNAGFGTSGYFVETDIPTELQMIQLHVIASVRLIHAALPVMIRRGQGGIINVSSVASLMALPGNATYSATKNYLNFFTRSLNAELAGTGVRVETLLPGFTITEFHDVQGGGRPRTPRWMWCRAEDVVEEALQGLREGREVVIPGRLYAAVGWALRFIPPELVTAIAAPVQRLRLKPSGKTAARPAGDRPVSQA